jgi:hypothetical protein
MKLKLHRVFYVCSAEIVNITGLSEALSAFIPKVEDNWAMKKSAICS